MSTPIAPAMRLNSTLAAQLLAVARRSMLTAPSAAANLLDPSAARRAAATAEHLRHRVSRLRAELGA